MNKEIKELVGEKWAMVDIDTPHVKGYKLQVSNYGRVRSITERFGVTMQKGANISGYLIVRAAFYKPRTAKKQEKANQYYEKIKDLKKQLKEIENKESTQFIVLSKELEKLNKEKKRFQNKDQNQRKVSFCEYTHRLVAKYFLPKPKENQTIVAHLDYNKHNNQASNLKWMTQEENMKHQQNSPYVIEGKKKRKERLGETKFPVKLTETRVMYLKKLLNEGKPTKQLVRMFKISETQIGRIKRGENWGHISPAD